MESLKKSLVAAAAEIFEETFHAAMVNDPTVFGPMRKPFVAEIFLVLYEIF